jgi:hypothetical protein
MATKGVETFVSNACFLIPAEIRVDSCLPIAP